MKDYERAWKLFKDPHSGYMLGMYSTEIDNDARYKMIEDAAEHGSGASKDYLARTLMNSDQASSRRLERSCSNIRCFKQRGGRQTNREHRNNYSQTYYGIVARGSLPWKRLRRTMGRFLERRWRARPLRGSELLDSLAKRLRSILKKGETWVDLKFPPVNESLAMPGCPLPEAIANKLISWKRPRDIGNVNANVELFANNVSPSDIVQGDIGDCYLLAALSSLAAAHARGGFDVRRLIDARHADIGLYGVKLFVRGRWITVVLDDYLPVCALPLLTNEAWPKEPTAYNIVRWDMCFARMSSRDMRRTKSKELWCVLIEKAFAKLSQSYAALDGCEMPSVVATLRRLTGCHAQNIRGCSLQMNGDERLWRRMKAAQARDALIMVVSLKKSEFECDHEHSLAPAHAYAVLAVLEVEDRREASGFLRLVYLRNPWGTCIVGGGWNGPFSRKSSSWSEHAIVRDAARDVEEQVRTSLSRKEKETAAAQEIQTGVRRSDTDDGTFGCLSGRSVTSSILR